MSVPSLRGAARLATDAVLGVTDVVEAAHATVLRPTGRPRRTRGITGFVYRTVRAVTRLVARVLDRGLGGAETVFPDLDDAPGPARAAAVAALNGAFGDTLADTGNPLATPTHLRHGGRPLDLGTVADPSGTVLVFAHGLCMHDDQWGDADHDPRAVLADALEATRLGLRYNSGRGVAAVADEVAALLERLVGEWPVPVRRLVVVAHSMGGLVMRRALAVAAEAGQTWPARDVALVCLGTPHHGAPLERIGNLVDGLLEATRWTAPYAALGKARSPGVTDLRYGTITPPDGTDRFARGPDRRPPTPLPEDVDVYLVAATLGDGRGGTKDQTLGDGLVPLASGLGRHADPAHTLAVPPERTAVFPRTSHFELLRDPAVTDRMARWLAPSASVPPR